MKYFLSAAFSIMVMMASAAQAGTCAQEINAIATEMNWIETLRNNDDGMTYVRFFRDSYPDTSTLTTIIGLTLSGLGINKFRGWVVDDDGDVAMAAICADRTLMLITVSKRDITIVYER